MVIKIFKSILVILAILSSFCCSVERDKRLYVYSTDSLTDSAVQSLIESTRLLKISADGKSFISDICSEWAISSDGTELTFVIRDNSLWSDGLPITSGQFEGIKTPIIFDGINADEKNTVTMIEASGDRSFVIRFSRPPVDPFLDIAGGTLGAQLLPVRNTGDRSVTVHPWIFNGRDSAGRGLWSRNTNCAPQEQKNGGIPFFNELIVSGSTEDHSKESLQKPYLVFSLPGTEFNGLAVDKAEVIRIRDLYHGTLSLQFNQTISDPVLSEIFRDRRFRKAVSLSLNREVLSGLVPEYDFTPRHVTPPEGDPWGQKNWDTMYIEQDTDLARRLLAIVSTENGVAEIPRFSIHVDLQDSGSLRIARELAGQLADVSLNAEIKECLPGDQPAEYQSLLTVRGMGRWNLRGFLPLDEPENLWGPDWASEIKDDSFTSCPESYRDVNRTIDKIAASNWEREKERLALDLYWMLTRIYPEIGIVGNPVVYETAFSEGLTGIGSPWFFFMTGEIRDLNLCALRYR